MAAVQALLITIMVTITTATVITVVIMAAVLQTMAVTQPLAKLIQSHQHQIYLHMSITGSQSMIIYPMKK